ncbi:MAG: hypothetical protein LBH18_05655, partial [Spirochaetaceae bacterium]|nr:hypothetical protein [Spirochaetaceae bacterium]
MKKNRYCTTASPRRKPEKELRKKLFRPFTRAAACVTAVFIILVSGITAFFIYNGLKKELVSRAAASARAAVISSALRLENAFTAARADALTLLQINGAERQSDIFFELHPEFAAIAPSTGRMLVNKSFFLEHDLSEKSLDNYLAAESELLEYAATLEDPADMLFGNASAYTGAPLLSMFFRDTEAGGTDGVIAAFFSLAAFTPLLESGTGNVVKTFVVNYRDDILLGSGGFFTPGGNYWRDPLVRLMRQSAETEAQSVFTGRDGGVYIGAFRKLPFTGTAVLCEISENAAFSGLPEAALGSLKFCGAALVLAAFFCAMLSFSMDKYAGGILREQEEKVMERRRLKSVFRALPTDRKT